MFLKSNMIQDAKQSQLNVEETYVLWDLTNVIYQAIDMVQIWSIYAHDLELKMILDRKLKKLQTWAKELEKELRKYSIN